MTEGLLIRPATQPELKRAVQRFEFPHTARGAAVVGWLANSGQLGIALLWPALPVATGFIWVPPNSRRTGVGTALLHKLSAAAREKGCKRLLGTFAVNMETAAWLERNGFSSRSIMREFSQQLDESYPRLAKAWERVERRVPETAHLVTLREAVDASKLEETAVFLARHVGGLPGQMIQGVQRKINGRSSPVYDLDCSLVLLDKERVIGARLTRFTAAKNCWFLESIAVDESFRGSWANIWLKAEGTRLMLESGRSKLCRFRAREDQTDTLRYAEHIHATLLETLKLMACDLT